MAQALPDIFATFTPQAAAMGATISVVLSPTPPVECLSTFVPGMEDRCLVPDSAIAFVSAAVSLSSIPRYQMAISMAAIW